MARPEQVRNVRKTPSLYPISNRIELRPSGRVGNTRGISITGSDGVPDRDRTRFPCPALLSYTETRPPFDSEL
jgi:hypothetical protein